MDGFVFWVKADLLSPSALYGNNLYGSTALAQNPIVVTPAAQICVQGSLHYGINRQQNIDETIDINSIVFTAESDIDDFNNISANELYIATYEGLRFSFSSRKPYYKAADLYHYIGNAIYPSFESQIIDNISILDNVNIVASNSIPLWMAMNQFMPIYPSFVVDQNLPPPYASVDISNTEAIQETPYIDQNTNQWQLVQEKAIVTVYGLRNFNIMDYVKYVMDTSLNDDFGIMNMPVVQDVKRTQSEMNMIAMKKTIEFQISYYQARMRNIARQLITQAFITVIK